MSVKKHILILLAVLMHSFVQSQIEVRAVIDSSTIRIGEQTKISLYLNYDASTQKNIEIVWPEIGDTLKKEIDVLNVTKIDTTIPDKSKPNIITQHLQLTITSFDSGAYFIPAFKFIINKDTTNPLLTNPLHLVVNTIATDTSLTKIKDIKAPFDEPFDWKWYLPYVYVGLAILAGILLLIFIIKKLNKKKPLPIIVEEVPKIPAHVTALAALEKIKQEAVWKDNKIKDYYSQITDTIRLYIEERFNINALEHTSEEILHMFKSQVVDSESKAKLHQILILSDFVKFAKQIPIETEHTLTLNNAFDFVNGTKRDAEILNDQTANKPNN